MRSFFRRSAPGEVVGEGEKELFVSDDSVLPLGSVDISAEGEHRHGVEAVVLELMVAPAETQESSRCC
jgi:hypothetical protein